MAFGFALAILVIGTPIVLIIRGLHEGLSWLARLVGDPSALVEGFVWVSSVAGGVILTAMLIKLLVRFFHWRGRLRTDVMTGQRWRRTGETTEELTAGPERVAAPGANRLDVAA